MASDLFSLCSSKQWAVVAAPCPKMQVRSKGKKEVKAAASGKRKIGSEMTVVLGAAFPTSKVLSEVQRLAGRLMLRVVQIPPPAWLDFWVASAA